VATAEAYPHAKFHLDPSNCLANVTDRTDNGSDSIGNRFTNGRPKSNESLDQLKTEKCLQLLAEVGTLSIIQQLTNRDAKTKV